MMETNNNQFQNRSWMADMLDLVARKAPEFMKVGGGSSGTSYQRRKAVKSKAYTDEEKAQIVAMAKSGKVSAVEIGKTLGRNPTRIRDLLKKAGVDIPDFRKKYTDTEREQIATMAQAGICCVDIARKLNRNQASVRDLVVSMGIKPRDGRFLGRNCKAA